MPKKILVVDDEPLIVKGLRYSLEQDGFFVDTAADGEEAMDKLLNRDFDLVLLDVMLPKMDGMQVCQKLREYSTIPIIMLTAKGDDIDKILGLEYGADDYMTKPFNVLEVKARVKSILRRVNTPVVKVSLPQSITIKGLTMHLDSRSVTMDDRPITLSAKEFDMLKLFMTSPGKVFAREELLEAIWRYDYMGDLRTVDVHIRRLREKLETDPGRPQYIFTKWGVGYYFAEN